MTIYSLLQTEIVPEKYIGCIFTIINNYKIVNKNYFIMKTKQISIKITKYNIQQILIEKYKTNVEIIELITTDDFKLLKSKILYFINANINMNSDTFNMDCMIEMLDLYSNDMIDDIFAYNNVISMKTLTNILYGNMF